MKSKILKIFLVVGAIIVILIFVACMLFSYNGGLTKFVFGNSYSINPTTDVDVISSLINGYSIFITVVLFIVGLPILLLSYNTKKESKEFIDETKKESKELKDETNKINVRTSKKLNEYEKKFKPIKAQIKESLAFKEVKDEYNVDPKNLWDGSGRKKLIKFNDCFGKKHGQDAQKYFFKALYLMKEVEENAININNISKEGIYEQGKIQKIISAINYFTLSEELVYENSHNENNHRCFCRFDIYREKSNAYKSLGLRFYKYNRAIALNHLLNALEYCQKAIYDDPSYMLTYNNKSNILKDIFRLCKEEEVDEDEKVFLTAILKEKIKILDQNIFDFKQIGEYVEKIYGAEQIRNDDVLGAILKLKQICDKNKENCAQCEWSCTGYMKSADKLDFDTLLFLIILESIICIKKKVIEKDFSFFREEKEDKINNIQRCYYNCAISDFMLLDYSVKTNNVEPKNNGHNNLSTDFYENLSKAKDHLLSKEFLNEMQLNNAINRYIEQIHNDVDLKPLFAEHDRTSESGKFMESLKKKTDGLIQKYL